MSHSESLFLRISITKITNFVKDLALLYFQFSDHDMTIKFRTGSGKTGSGTGMGNNN